MRRHEHLTWGTVVGVVIALALLTGLVIACVTAFPALLVGPDAGVDTLSRLDRLKAENDVRMTLLQGLGGLLALGGVAFGAAITLRQIRVNREANTIGLFTKAIEQLSDENISVRHGGVYALELLAGLDRRYRGYIHALLTAFIRQRAPWPPDRPDVEVGLTAPGFMVDWLTTWVRRWAPCPGEAWSRNRIRRSWRMLTYEALNWPVWIFVGFASLTRILMVRTSRRPIW